MSVSTRSVTTKVAVEGEDKYRAAIADINTELKAMQSELRLTEALNQNQQNTYSALSDKLKALENVYASQQTKIKTLEDAMKNCQTAQAKYSNDIETAKAKYAAATKALDDYKQSGGNDVKVLEQLQREQDLANQELTKAEANYNAATRGVNNWASQLANAKVAAADTNAQIELNKKYLDEAKNSADGCATSINQFGERVDKAAENLEGFAEAMAASGLAQTMQQVVDGMVECYQEFAAFDEAMAGVMRTTGMTSEEIDVLGQDFQDLSTTIPMSTNDLASIAETAGQLGIASENVENFTTVMAKLATTTDLEADTAATMLAQFANITQMDPANYDRLGSTLAALGDSSATTASRITTMSEGIAATASICGMSEKDILAISTAVGSVGIESGMGSTAINTFLSNINKAVQKGGDDLETFANVAGMSAGQFKAAWENDAAGAFQTLIEGIAESENSTATLNELGITAARQTRVILSLASAGDTLSDAFELANEAWEENTALDEKAQIMWTTAAADLTKLKDSVTNLKTSIGDSLAPVLDPLINKAQDVVDGVKDFIDLNPKLATGITTIISGVGALTTALLSLSAVIKVIKGLEIGSTIKMLGSFFSNFGSSIASLLGTGGSIIAGGLAVGATISSVETSKYNKAVENGTATTQQALRMDEGKIGEGHDVSEYQENYNAQVEEYKRLKEQRQSYADMGLDTTVIDQQIADQYQNLIDANQELQAAQHESTYDIEATAAALNEAGIETEGLTDAEIVHTAAVYDAQSAIEAYTEAYEENRAAALGAIESATGLFDALEADDDAAQMSASGMIEAWQAQTDSINDYADRLEQLRDAGVSEELLAQLSDGSAESVAYVETLSNSLDDLDVSALNEAYEEAQTAKEQFADTAASIETDATTVTDTVSATFEGLPDGMYDVGTEVISNIQSGLSSQSGALYSQVTSIVNNAIAKAEAAAGGSGEVDGVTGAYASGTTSAKPGLAWVGENGPELMMMHGGEQILDAVHTAALMNQIDSDNAFSRTTAVSNSAVTADNRVIAILSNYLPQLLAKDNNTYLDGAMVSKKLANSMNTAINAVNTRKSRVTA